MLMVRRTLCALILPCATQLRIINGCKYNYNWFGTMRVGVESVRLIYESFTFVSIIKRKEKWRWYFEKNDSF